jgi:nucleolar protein 15
MKSIAETVKKQKEEKEDLIKKQQKQQEDDKEENEEGEENEFTKTQKSLPLTSSQKKKLKKQRQKQQLRGNGGVTDHGFMYIGHLPHGFYEKEIKEYFSQFGRVIQLRLARSKKTGNRKGYGFIEFENIKVATIAAETMNNYLMFNKVLKCHLIPKDKLNKMTFKNANKVFHMPLKTSQRKRFNRKRSDEDMKVSLI